MPKNQSTVYGITYAQAILDLQQSGGLSLANIQELPYVDLSLIHI